MTFEFEKVSDTSYNVHVTTGEPKSELCHDTILFGNTEVVHIEQFYFKGRHTL